VTRRREGGFTLIELLATLALLSILLTLSVGALRRYWFVQSLKGAQTSMVSQLRQIQERVNSESHPFVYGARFTDSGGWNARGKFGLVKYDPNGGGVGVATCTQYSDVDLSSGFGPGVALQNITFNPSVEQTFCRSNLIGPTGSAIAAASDKFVVFYGRGSATGGSLEIISPVVANTVRPVVVNGVTGRVTGS
jgi:prepilin-type N-terminal cleavage/methylation domain-containing protein